MLRHLHRDPAQAEIATYGRTLHALYKQCDRDIRFPFDPTEWWTAVALRSAAAGAAVALGHYRSATAEGELAGSPARVLRFKLAIGGRAATRRAYRIAVWGYMAEITAELWPHQYEAELTAAAGILQVKSPHEKYVWGRGRELLRELPDDGASDALRDFRLDVLGAMTMDAAGLDERVIGDPAGRREDALWLASYEHGREVVAGRLKRLASTDAPPLGA
jgi:hypothetical protein